jgi:hypothetical protein
MKDEKLEQTQRAKVDPQTALQEFERWISIKRIRDQKRQENTKNKSEDLLVSAIVEGDISIDEDGYINHNLIFPLENADGSVILNKLRYMPRIPQKLLNIKLKGVEATDGDRRIIAYGAALTNQNMGLIEQMDTEDQRIMQAIVLYFL